MGNGQSQKRSAASKFVQVLKKLVQALSGTKPFIELLADVIESRFERMKRRMWTLAIAYLTLFAGIVFFIIGLFFVLVDFAGIPRALVFTGGGIIVILVSIILVNSKKKGGI